MIGKIHTIGYTAPNAMELVQQLMSNPNTLLIDTRYSPYSRLPEWRQDALAGKYGARYRYAGQFLGNVNFRGGPIHLAQPKRGIAGLTMYLREGHDLILLCACADYERCHRKEIVDRLLKQMPEVEVVQSGMSLTDTLPCLSINQPWAWLIANGYKDIENREWSISYRGPLLLHAGKKIDSRWFYPARHEKKGQLYHSRAEQYDMDGIMPAHKDEYAIGAIVGIAQLVDIVTDHESDWFEGTYGFVLENARTIEPVPYRGALKLFPVPRSVVAHVWQEATCK